MKSFATLALICLLVPVSCSYAQNGTPANIPLVTTSGTAEIRVVPDLADLSFEIEVRNPNLEVARAEEEARSKKVLAKLRSDNLAETELQTSQMEVSTVTYDRTGETDTVQFYVISQEIACTLHDVKAAPQVTLDALHAGVTGVHPTELRTSQLRTYRDQARSQAIRAAKEKAIALATELGAKIGKPFSITESTGADNARTYWGAGSNSNAQVTNFASSATGPGSDITQPTFAPGTIKISATVTVSFLLE